MDLRRLAVISLKLGLIAACSAFLLVLSFYLSVRMMIVGHEVRVPDLRGKTTAAAETLVRPSGLYVEKTAERYDPRVPAGAIISQTPEAGASIKPKRKIKVVVSLGTEVLQVPDFSGEAERKAILEIEQVGLRLGEVARISSAAPSGRVIAQAPAADSPTLRGEKVSLMVSRGPRDPVWVMPDLTGQPIFRVERVLEERGLKVGGTTFEAAPGPDGAVLKQFPLPGYPVSRQDTITLVVSRGNPA